MKKSDVVKSAADAIIKLADEHGTPNSFFTWEIGGNHKGAAIPVQIGQHGVAIAQAVADRLKCVVRFSKRTGPDAPAYFAISERRDGQ